jgi:NADPH-dependent curcumin reductase CurA
VTETNLQVTLKSRPQGWVRESDFELVESPLPPIGDAEVLLKTLYLSLDPYMRSRMDDAKSYAKNLDIGDVMIGGTVSEVVDRLGAYAQAGAETAYLQVLDLDDLDHVRFIASEVLPAV